MHKTKISLEYSDIIFKVNELSGHNGSIYSLAHDPEDEYFYSVGGDGWIVRWDASGILSDGVLVANTESKLFSVAMISHCNLLVAGDIHGHLYWIDISQNSILSRTIAHKSSIFDLCILDNKLLVAISGDGYFSVWDIKKRSHLISIKISGQGLRCVDYDNESKKLYIGSSDHNIYVVNRNDWTIENKINQAHGNSVFTLKLLSSEIIASGGRDAHFKIRNIDESASRIIADHAAHWFTINKIEHLKEVNLIATASRDKTYRLWDDQTYAPILTIDIFKGGHINSINTMIWIPEHNILGTAGDDRIIKLWKISSFA